VATHVQQVIERGMPPITPRQRAPGDENHRVAARSDGPDNIAELAARLWEPLRQKLRAELLVDRERAGYVTDVR
jgi:hypothetical protein